MRIFYENRVDNVDTIITAASENAHLPVANVADPDRGKTYRTGVTLWDEALVFDFGSAKSVRSVILLDHTLTAGDSDIYVQGNESDSWGSPSFEEEITFAAGTIVHRLASLQTYQFWRVIFTKSSDTEYRDVGRVFLGQDEEMDRGPKMPDGLTITPNDLSTTERAIGGKTYSERRGVYNTIAIDFPPIGDVQMEILKAVAAYCGTHTTFFVSIDPTNEPVDLLFYVKAKSLKARKAKMWGSAPVWDAEMELNEEI